MSIVKPLFCGSRSTAAWQTQLFRLNRWQDWYVTVVGRFFFFLQQPPQWARASSFTRFLNHTDTTLGRTPLDEWSARRTDLYLATHNTHNRQTSMPPVGFEPAIPASERLQTHALDRAATGTGEVNPAARTTYTAQRAVRAVCTRTSNTRIFSVFYANINS